LLIVALLVYIAFFK